MKQTIIKKFNFQLETIKIVIKSMQDDFAKTSQLATNTLKAENNTICQCVNEAFEK
jgi:hypothetical protein